MLGMRWEQVQGCVDASAFSGCSLWVQCACTDFLNTSVVCSPVILSFWFSDLSGFQEFFALILLVDLRAGASMLIMLSQESLCCCRTWGLVLWSTGSLATVAELGGLWHRYLL